MPLLHKIVFYVFLLAYLVGCPLTILYVLGYAVRPGPEQGFVKTGLISLATVPPGASIYVGGRRYSRQTPAVLNGLYPGEYRVKVVLKRRHPWMRTVRVEAEKATILEKILLLPQRPVARVLLPASVQEVIPIPETRLFVLAMGPKIEDVVVYDRETAASWPVLPEASPFRGSRVIAYVVVRGSPFLFLRVRFQGGETYLGASLRSEQAHPADLTNLFPMKPQWVTWDPRWPHQLFSVQGGFVNRLDLETMAIHPKIVDRIHGFGVSDQALYVLTDDFLLLRVDGEGRRVQTPFDGVAAGEGFSRTSGLFQIRVFSEELAVLRGERGELWVSRFPSQFVEVEGGVRGFEVDPQHERLLIWWKDRLGILDCSAKGHEDHVPEPTPNPHWVVRGGRDIQQAFWVHDASHVVFRDGDAIRLLELEPPGAPAPVSLLRVRAGSAVAYAEESGGLYYLDRLTGMLSFLEVIQRTGLRVLPFPERQMPTGAVSTISNEKPRVRNRGW